MNVVYSLSESERWFFVGIIFNFFKKIKVVCNWYLPAFFIQIIKTALVWFCEENKENCSFLEKIISNFIYPYHNFRIPEEKKEIFGLLIFAQQW